MTGSQKDNDIESRRLEFEREKWRAELDIRKRELLVREREQQNRESETDIKRQETLTSKWRSPLVVAIFAAAVAGAGNAVVSGINGSFQRDVDNRKHEAEFKLEASKAESTRILEMIKTGDSEKAAANLTFLLEAGLISDKQRASEVRRYLSNRKPGGGPSLPAPASSTQFEFQPTPSLTDPIKHGLERDLTSYTAYLEKIGIKTDARKVAIRIEKFDGITKYDPVSNEIVVHSDHANESLAVLFGYSTHILNVPHPMIWSLGSGPQNQPLTIMPALAIYFVCNALQKPEFTRSQVAIRTCNRAKEERKFVEFGVDADNFPQNAADIWASLFFRLRDTYSEQELDTLLVQSWISVKWSLNAKNFEMAKAFTDVIVKHASEKYPQKSSSLTSVLEQRGFPFTKH